MAQANYAFVGQVTSITTFADRHEVVFSVPVCWKGLVDSQITIQTNLDGGSCGYTFEQLRHHVVFSQDTGGLPQTGSCSGNAGVTAGTMEYGDLPTAGTPGDCEITALDKLTWGLIKARHP